MEEEAPGDHAGEHDNGPEYAAVHVRVGLGLKRGSSELCSILPLLLLHLWDLIFMNTDKIKRHYKVKSNIIGLTDVVVVIMSDSV